MNILVLDRDKQSKLPLTLPTAQILLPKLNEYLRDSHFQEVGSCDKGPRHLHFGKFHGALMK